MPIRRLALAATTAWAAALPSLARAVDATLAGTTLHVTADAPPAGGWVATQLMIDADGDAKTGLRLGDHGYDAMVEGATLYAFMGPDRAAWSWRQLGAAKRGVDGKTLTIDVDTALLPGKSASATVSLRALTADLTTLVATLPATTVDLTGAAAAKPATTTMPAGFGAAVMQDGTDLVIRLTAAKPEDLNTTIVFFDSDANAATGFAPPADPRFGFEYMIQGGSLAKHAGPGRDAWAWTTITPVKQTIAGNAAELRFNASLLKGTTPKVAAWQMSADWQTRADVWPKSPDGKASTSDVKLDATKLRAALTAADVPLAAVRADANQPARQRFAAAKSYACYYGAGSLGPLSHVDAAILHTPAMTPADVRTLGKIGVVTIGYLTVGEDETLRVGNGTGFDGKASWYFDKDKDGKPDMNGTWGSVYANAADPAWRADRLAEAKRLCGSEYGFDGLFLDTIETVDAYPASRDGMIELVKELRAALPDKVIVINRGFSLLKEPAVSGNIDGLMFESFTTSYDFDSKSYIRFLPQDMDATRATMTSTVMPAMKDYKLQVLALDYCEPGQTDRIQEAFDRAKTFGMLPAVAPISLDLVYDTASVVAKRDDKYLDLQATPQSMQATLDAPRNGFPAGTIVRPSSCFMGYVAATVVDGVDDHSKLNWTRAAWASAEEPGAKQSLLFTLPEPIAGGTLAITFAYDNKARFPSRDFAIESSTDGTTWQTVAHPTANAESTFKAALPNEPIRQLRVTQSPGGGSAERPNLMWVQQVKRLP